MIIIPKLNFPKYYGCLFRGVESALNAIQKQNYVQAQDILIKAQQEAEDLFLADTDEQRECMREQQNGIDFYAIATISILIFQRFFRNQFAGIQ